MIAATTLRPCGTVAGDGVFAVTVHVSVPNCAIAVSLHDTETYADSVTVMLHGTGKLLYAASPVAVTVTGHEQPEAVPHGVRDPVGSVAERNVKVVVSLG